MKTRRLIVLAMVLVAGCESTRPGVDGSAAPEVVNNGRELRNQLGKMVRLDGAFATRPKGGLGIVPDGMPLVYVYLGDNPTFDAMNHYGLSSNLDLDGKRISVFGRLEWDPPITSDGTTDRASALKSADPSTYERSLYGDPAMYDVTSVELDATADLSDQFAKPGLPGLPPPGLNPGPIGLPFWSQTGRYVMRDFWWRELPEK